MRQKDEDVERLMKQRPGLGRIQAANSLRADQLAREYAQRKHAQQLEKALDAWAETEKART